MLRRAREDSITPLCKSDVDRRPRGRVVVSVQLQMPKSLHSAVMIPFVATMGAPFLEVQTAAKHALGASSARWNSFSDFRRVPPAAATLADVGPLRVIIVDDESLLRRALRVFVSAAEDIEVVGEAADGAEAVELVQTLTPDVVLMDVQMPVLDGASATRIITRDHPATKVLALTTFGSMDSILPMLHAGAGGYLLKDSEPEDIVAALRDVDRGLRVLSPSVASLLVSSVAQSLPSNRPTNLTGSELLTPRERAIVVLLARGLSNAEMAKIQSVSEATVKSHLSNIMSKWSVRDRVQVLIRAVRAGIVSFD